MGPIRMNFCRAILEKNGLTESRIGGQFADLGRQCPHIRLKLAREPCFRFLCLPKEYGYFLCQNIACGPGGFKVLFLFSAA